MEEALDLLLKDVSALNAGPGHPMRFLLCAPGQPSTVADHDLGHVGSSAWGSIQDVHWAWRFTGNRRSPPSSPPRSETVRHPGAVALDRTQAAKCPQAPATGREHGT